MSSFLRSNQTQLFSTQISADYILYTLLSTFIARLVGRLINANYMDKYSISADDSSQDQANFRKQEEVIKYISGNLRIEILTIFAF